MPLIKTFLQSEKFRIQTLKSLFFLVKYDDIKINSFLEEEFRKIIDNPSISLEYMILIVSQLHHIKDIINVQDLPSQICKYFYLNYNHATLE